MGSGVTSRPIIPLTIAGSGATYTAAGTWFDYAINGLAFNTHVQDDNTDLSARIERALAPIRKTQVDQSSNPGEQSLDSWWLRSQTDWSGGAGISFMEPPSSDRIQRSFNSSAGVDPWTIGQASLLRSTESVRTIASSATPFICRYGQGSGFYWGANATVERWDGTSFTAVSGFTGVLASLTIGGSKLLATDTSGNIQSGTAGGTTLAALWTTASGATKSWWVKQRLITAQGVDLFELSTTTGGNLDVQVPFYTHPDSTWVWTAAFDAPGAILAAGYGAAGSAIYKFMLNAGTGALPTLTGALTTAEFPVGEYIVDAVSYLGAYVAIATNLGVRVGTISSAGDVTYGPFTYEGATVGGFRAFSRFVYTGVADAGEGRDGLIRIDLSDIGEDGRAPWANDIRIPSGAVPILQSFAVVSTSSVYLACSSTSATLYGCTSASNLEATGYVRTGFIRYGTLENKNFDSIKIEASKPLAGTITVASIDKDGVEASLGSFTSTTGTDELLRISSPSVPTKHIALRFTLSRGAVATTGPTLELWQMRAIPSPARSELQQIPMLCFDFEKDKFGQNYGYEGSASARWIELRDSVRESKSVRFQNFVTGETVTCVVEELSFKQSATPSGCSGFGGVILLTIRDL